MSCAGSPFAMTTNNMDIDDSKYLLQLARAGGVSLPPGPGDWSLHVKPAGTGRETEGGEQFMYSGVYVNDNQLAHPPATSPIHEAMPTQQQPTPMTSPRSYHDPASRGTPGPQHGYSRPPPPPPTAHHRPPQGTGSPHSQPSYHRNHHTRTQSHTSHSRSNRPRSSDDSPPNPQIMAAKQDEARRRRLTTGVAGSPAMHGAHRQRSSYSPSRGRVNDAERRPIMGTRQPESWEWYYYGEVPLPGPANPQ